MQEQTKTTTSATPADCPSCGYVFGITDAATMTAHFLAHLVFALRLQGPADNRDTQPDW